MKLKETHLWLNQNYSEIRHWLLVVMGVILLGFSMVSIGNQNQLLKKNAELTEATKKLGEDNKELNTNSQRIAKQNQELAKKNQQYTLCLAQIFAQYTHDFVPIDIKNLDRCTFSVGNNTSGEASEAPENVGPGSSNGSSPNRIPQNGQPQQNNSQPAPTPEPPEPPRDVDVTLPLIGDVDLPLI